MLPPLPTDRYEFTDAYDEQVFAIAATTIAADLIATAGSDGPSVFQNLDLFVAAVSCRGSGFREPQLATRVLRNANVAIWHGVSY